MPRIWPSGLHLSIRRPWRQGHLWVRSFFRRPNKCKIQDVTPLNSLKSQTAAAALFSPGANRYFKFEPPYGQDARFSVSGTLEYAQAGGALSGKLPQLQRTARSQATSAHPAGGFSDLSGGDCPISLLSLFWISSAVKRFYVARSADSPAFSLHFVAAVRKLHTPDACIF